VPRIEFLDSAFGPGKTVEAPQGGVLVDLCDEHYAPIPFSCRSATCGTCHVIIVHGAEHLEAPNEAEAELLAILRGPKASRLACQAVVKAEEGLVQLRSIDG
jgi:2Fe-2S ferredoxin